MVTIKVTQHNQDIMKVKKETSVRNTMRHIQSILKVQRHGRDIRNSYVTTRDMHPSPTLLLLYDIFMCHLVRLEYILNTKAA